MPVVSVLWTVLTTGANGGLSSEVASLRLCLTNLLNAAGEESLSAATIPGASHHAVEFANKNGHRKQSVCLRCPMDCFHDVDAGYSALSSWMTEIVCGASNVLLSKGRSMFET